MKPRTLNFPKDNIFHFQSFLSPVSTGRMSDEHSKMQIFRLLKITIPKEVLPTPTPHHRTTTTFLSFSLEFSLSAILVQK